MTFADAVWQPESVEIVDTHCHYNLEPLRHDWRAHWQKAQALGVWCSWIPGTNIETSRRAIEIARQDEHLFAWIGIHPADGGVGGELETVMASLQTMIDEDRQRARPVILGVGEIGLDYFRLAADDEASRILQHEWFAAQLELANRNQLPVMLHVRDQEAPELPAPGNAYWDVVAALQSWSLPFSLHCVSGPVAYVQTLLEKGAYCGFDGNSTYPKAEHLRDLYKLVPSDHRLLETDAPYLPPQGWRGQVCEPWMITETAKMIARMAL